MHLLAKLAVGLVLGGAIGTLMAQFPNVPSVPVAPSGGVAVVELFTSEGCSSCPPADQALLDLVERSAREGTSAFALSFHVDYWNRLGWKDPFSAPAWSERQRTYSGSTRDQVYTPQCVVNGERSFVGSDVGELDRAVIKGLAEPAAIAITATVLRTAEGVQVNYTLTGDATNAELNVALVESSLATNVRAGENSGRHLAHTHVVRTFRTLAINGTGTDASVELSLAPVNDPANAQVILFAQRRGQGAVLGATSAKVPGRKDQ